MRQRYSGVILTLLFAAAAAGPINIELFQDSRTCAKRCIDNHKFDYSNKLIYVYEYEADSKTSIVGASEDSASIRIKATVEIEPSSACDFEMRLKDVSLVDPHQLKDVSFSPEEFSRVLAQWPLRFSFQDGRIEDLCPNAEDPTWSLNIKRGVLSLFQNSMTRLEKDQKLVETDVTGNCETTYSASKRGFITKTKDMVSCKHRQGVHSAVQSIGYDAKSSIQSLAIMKSSYSCQQHIDKENKLVEATCMEKHVFRPFSNGDNGAATVNSQKMVFKRAKKGGKQQQGEVSVRTNLLYSHQFGEITTANAGNKIQMKLQELCQISKEDVRPEQPQLFGDLIKAMKMADIASLRGIHDKIKNGQICRENHEKIKQIFHDAIPMVGTTSSLQLIRDLIWKREVVDLEKDMWLASLPFIQNPEKEMISAIKPLLEDKNVKGNTILMVSSLVSGYCAVNPNCGKVAEVSEIMDVLGRLIATCSTKGPYEKTLYALRAIGNIGHSSSIVPRLTQCFTRREIPVHVRLAAINAFRRIPCDAMRVDLLDLFNDVSEDAELRINAYIALIKCPQKNIVMRIKEALRTEKVNQVGSFVWTHLTNLKETSDPHLQGLRAILEDVELKKEFRKDNLKFSHNYEGSFFFDEINTGGRIDSNVIFSPKSFVPRSANLNLTIDLFGHAINFFEIGTRMEGVEHFLERYIKNSDYFSDMKDPATSQKFPMREFDDKYKVDIDTLKGFAYMRMFGNELGFWNFENPNLSFFKNFDIKKWIKDEKIVLNKNMALMDTQLILPTILGLPLNLTVAALASIELEAMGKMNLASLKNIEIGGSIKPSGAVKVVSEMTVDAFATKAGLRMNSLAHSSTEAKLSFKMKNSKMIESKFELPKKNMEIITFKSDFAIIKGDEVKTQKMIDNNRFARKKCTGDNFNKVTGLKMCAQLEFSNASMKHDAPYFPMNGPIVMQVELANHDIPMGYIMKTHMNEATQFGFEIDTPNSKVSRKISMDVNVDKQKQMIELDSPWKKIAFNGKFVKTRNTQLISGEVILDHKNSKIDKYSASFQMDHSSGKGGMKWVPKVVIMSPTRQMIIDGNITSSGKEVGAYLKATGFFKDDVNFKLTALKSKKEYSCTSTLRFGPKEYLLKTKMGMLPKGKAVTYSPELSFSVGGKEIVKFVSSFLYNPNSKIIASVKLDKVFSKIVALNTKIIMNNNKKKMKNTLLFNLKAPQVTVDVKGMMELKESRFISRVATSYNIGKYQDKLVIYSKLLDESTKTLSLYKGDLIVESNKYPKYNFIQKGQFGKADDHIETKLSLEIGNPKKNPDKFNFESMLNYHFKPMTKHINFTMDFKRPSKNVDVGLKLSHMNKMGKSIDSYVEVKYGAGKTADVQVQFSMDSAQNFEGFVSVKHMMKELFRMEDVMTSKNPQNYKNNFKLILPDGRMMSLESMLEKKSDRSFFMSNHLQLPNRGHIKVTSQMHIERENGSMNIEVDADRVTAGSGHWNPKFTFNYHINMHRQKLSLFKCMLKANITPTKMINIVYSLSMLDNSIVHEILIESTFKGLKRLESKYKNERSPKLYKENFHLKIDDHYSYEEEYVVKFEKRDFLFDYAVKGKFYDEAYDFHIKCSHDDRATKGMIKFNDKYNNLKLEVDVAHASGKLKIKSAADITLSGKGLAFTMKSDTSVNWHEVSCNSEGEFNLQHPKVTLQVAYFARADANRISFDTNFVSPTSRHRNGKLNIEIGMDDERTRLMGKFDVDYNGKRLYSLNTGYTKKDMVHNFQLAFLLPSGERITTVFNLSLSGGQKRIHAEIKLPRALQSFELDMDGSMDCMQRICDYKLLLTTNTMYFRKMVANMKHGSGVIDLEVGFNGFEKEMQFVAKIEGERWSEKKIMSDFKLNGEEKLRLEGNYAFESIRNVLANLMVTSKIGRTNDKFSFSLKREVSRNNKGRIEISGVVVLFNEKYTAELTGTDFTIIEIKVHTPTCNYVITMNLNKLKWNDFDVMLKIQQDSKVHEFSFLNRHFQEIKLSVALASYKNFDIIYNGGIDDRKRGSFRLKISYGEYFIESNSTVNLGNQFELKSTVAFKFILQSGPNPKVHTGSGEIKLMHHMDSIFQKISGTFIYGKEKIIFSSLVKNIGKININIRLKTTFKFNVQLKAQISPDLYSANMLLSFESKWTGSKKLTYSHSGQKGKSLEIKADLMDGKAKEADYALNVKLSMKNDYGLNIEIATDKMTKKYVFDGELTMKKQMEKGRLRVETPFAFMGGMPIEISFKRDGSKFISNGSFKMMEYGIDLEYSAHRVMTNAYVNWNKQDRASNFKFEMTFDDASQGARTDKKFEIKLIHPVRTVAFSTKYVKNLNMLDMDIVFSGNAEQGQKIGFGFGRTQNAGYVKLALPERTYRFSGRLDTDSGRQVFSGSFFWNFNKDDTKKIDLIVTIIRRDRNAILDVILKFPSQTEGIRLKSELIWHRGDTLFKSKTEFSLNQDPKNLLTFQTELLKDDNNKYTLTMAVMHPKSGLDMLIIFRMFELNNMFTVSMDMKDGQENVNMMAYLDKTKRKIGWKLRTPSDLSEIVAGFRKENDYEVFAKLVEGSEKPMEAYINVSPRRKNLKIQVNYDDSMPENLYRIDGGLLTKKMVMVEAFRMRKEEKITDAQTVLKVDDSNILHVKIEWNPRMFGELNEFLHGKMMRSMHRMRVMMEHYYQNMVEQGRRVTYALNRAYLPEIRAIETSMAKEFYEVKAETQQMFQNMIEMYNRDYLYVYTIARHMKTVLQEIELELVNVFSYLEYELRNGLIDSYRFLLHKMEEAKMEIAHIYQESYRKLAYDIDQARYYVMEKVAMLNSLWERKRDEYLQKLNELNRKTYQAVFDHKYTKAILLAIDQRWDELVDFMRRNDMMKPVSDMISYLRMNTRYIMEKRDWLIHELKNHQITHEIFDLMNEFYQKLLWAYKYWEVEETVRNLDDYVKNYITKTANGIREQIFSMNQIELINFNLHSGLIEFKFPIVMPKVIVENQARVARLMRMVKTTMRKFSKWHPSNDYTPADIYYSLKQYLNPVNWIPPFSAQAYIFNNQHIKTFDGLHMDFIGACSYILTRDFVDNNLTVIAKFGNINKVQKIESVIFNAGSEQIEIFHNYQIRHNDQKVDLPIKLNALSVNRVGNMIEIKSHRGFTIIYYPSKGTIIVNVSGWYFGKLAGLFGTFNNEQYDDMIMPLRHMTTNIDEFASSWAMSRCRSQQNFAHHQRKNLRCDGWFNKTTSPFRNCFKQVEPKNFYDACNTADSAEVDHCYVAQFYVDLCKEKGVPLVMPASCMTCKTKRGEAFMLGDKVEFSKKDGKEEIMPSADVVFVVEQRKCNERIVSELNRIIQGLEQTLRNKGMSDNRYGLVGFGGDNIRPEYMVTIRSELMASAGLIMNEVRKLDFYDGYSMTDPLKAINLATQYPFRPATRKTIVLVTCNMFCHEKTVPYHKVMSQLKEHDIALHLLQKYEFEILGNRSPKTTDLYGIDSKQVYTKTVGEAKEKMFETIKLPSGDCAELSLASNGSVFDADKMSRSDMSMFVHKFSQRIADSLELVDCHTCHCGENVWGMVQSICSRCPSIIPHSTPLYLPGKVFLGNLQINENLKEQLNMYWKRFQKKDLKGQSKPASKKSPKGQAKPSGKKNKNKSRR